MQNRTDLALECYEESEKTKISGVRVKEENGVTRVSVLNENGEREIGKPQGEYITVEVPSFTNDTDIFDGRLSKISDILKNLLPPECDNVLVVGLGNMDITADALGPKTGSYIFATRHISDELKKQMGFENLKSVSCICTGVLGETGIESAEIIKGVCNVINPSCIIAVDALAASSAKRLGTTVQISNTGISPGSGVGNHRFEISKSTLGVPVISIGIPTVVSTAVISGRQDDSMFVTPREIDRLTEQGAKLIGMSINVCLQSCISERDLYTLVG
uniref:GPR endopeptidase n=1 Tax=Eubacterium sp. TaxID=142586 RepID=UPI004027F090